MFSCGCGGAGNARRRSKASHLGSRRRNVTGLRKDRSRRSAANLICDNNLYVNISVTGLAHRGRRGLHNTRYSNSCSCWNAKMSTLLFYSSSSLPAAFPSHQIHSFQSIMQQAIHTSTALQYSRRQHCLHILPFHILHEYNIFAANKRNSRNYFTEIFQLSTYLYNSIQP